MNIEQFDYELPKELIAQEPATPRDSARLLVLHRATGKFEHRQFRDLFEYVAPGDCLVLNDTRVMPARLFGQRMKTEGKWEGLYLGEREGLGEFLTKTRGHIEVGETIALDGGNHQLELVRKTPEKTWLIRPTTVVNCLELVDRIGHVPLPPYIRGGKDAPFDRERYQTVYATKSGAVAAPTAGLHFTPEMLEELSRRNVDRENVTLHVGPGTFQPVKADKIEDHVMHSEWCELSEPAAAHLTAVRAAGKRIIAVGTTSVRVLESAVAVTSGKIIPPFSGATSIFLRPPHIFRAVDAMLTNFHLPRSTLLMLVAAFAGREQIIRAYRAAVREKYRFFSYGDAMLIL